MAILSRPKISPQQRYDLEDFLALLSGLRTDSKYQVRQFLSAKNLIMQGFSVTGIGLQQATIQMAGATLIIPEGSSDFSWFSAEDGASDEIITDAQLTDNARNYVEIQLATQGGTPLIKAFWDSVANSGDGLEFNQLVDTITDLVVSFTVSTGGFSGSPDKIPLCIIDTNVLGNITVILDRRELFGRLAVPSDLDNEFSWGTKQEPVYQLTLSGVSGTFQAGEIIAIGSETATVVTGGTTSITFNRPSGIAFASGDSVTGATSGATGTVSTIFETFSGVDKSLKTQDDINKALMTEIKNIKNTNEWYADANSSLEGTRRAIDSVLVQEVLGASWAWSGTDLSITDSSGSPADADNLARLRLIGDVGDLLLSRQDGQGGSTTIALSDGEVAFIKLPAKDTSRTYSGVGVSDTNYQVVDADLYENSDSNYWLAYCHGSVIYVRGYGELESGETTPITDPDKETILATIDANREASNQDRQLKLIEGGTWSLVDNAGTYELTLSAAAYVQVSGLTNIRNTISAQTINLPNANSVAYISLERTSGAQIFQTVTVADVDTLLDDDNRVIIARRVSDGVLVGTGCFLLKPDEYLELDGALAELNRLLGQLKLVAHETDADKVRVSAADSSLLDGNTLSQAIGSFLLSFDGAVIDFTTGDVFKADGITALGVNFTPFTIPAGEYFWYGVSLFPGSLNADNTQNAVLQIDLASASDAVQADAPKPIISGTIKRGAVQVQNNGGNIEVVEIRRLGVGSGSGSGSSIKATYLDPLSTTLPAGTSVTIDGQSGVDGDTVLFSNLSSGNNRIYQLGGVGVSLTWTAVSAFEKGFDPEDGDSVRIKAGDSFQEQLAVFNGTEFLVNDVVRYFDGVSGDFWELGSIKTSTLTDNTTASVFEVSVAGSENIIVSYSITRGSAKETGELYITSDGTNVSVVRPSSYINDVEVEFVGDVVSGDLRLRYTTASTGSDATMKYFLKRWSDSPGGPTGVPSYSGASGSTAAAGSVGDIQYHALGGLLGGDSRFQWDVTNGLVNLNGMEMTVLSPGITINDNQGVAATLVSFDKTTYPFVIFEYSIQRGTDYRVGRLLISNDGTNIGFSDDFVESNSTGVTISATISGSNLLIQYTSTSTGQSGTFKYNVRRWS